MTEPAAFEAEVYSLRTAPDRGIVAVTLHCPIEWLQKVVGIVGGKGARVAVARLDDKPAKQPEAKNRRPWNTLTPTEQAGIRSNDVVFEQYINERYPEFRGTPADFIRMRCGVKSRAELASDQDAASRWNELDITYQAWVDETRIVG